MAERSRSPILMNLAPFDFAQGAAIYCFHTVWELGTQNKDTGGVFTQSGSMGTRECSPPRSPSQAAAWDGNRGRSCASLPRSPTGRLLPSGAVFKVLLQVIFNFPRMPLYKTNAEDAETEMAGEDLLRAGGTRSAASHPSSVPSSRLGRRRFTVSHK